MARTPRATRGLAPVELRPATDSDLDDIRRLVNLARWHDGAHHVLSAQELREDFGAPYVAIALDTRVALLGGELVGCAWVRNPPVRGAQDRAYVFGAVHPERRGHGAGGALLGWAVARATERLRSRSHDLPRYIRVATEDTVEANCRLYARLGFRPVRYFDELVRPLTGLPEVSALSGAQLAPWPDNRDSETLGVRNEAFTDHWGSAPFDEATWHREVHGYGARLDLSVVVVTGRVTGGEIVGLCLNHAYPEDEALTGRREGWIEHLATERTHRRRGFASAMIAWALAAFQAGGMTHAMIGVDSENLTGAARLYRSLGFERQRRSITFQIQVSDNEPEA